ncbi:MAG: NADH-quinone oxidoreductase subunit D [Candidatus Xenobia bacterium]
MAQLDVTPAKEYEGPGATRLSRETTHVVTVRPTLPPSPEATEPFVVNFGPQHPSMHGVFRLQAVLDGEKVLSVEPFVMYMHRNFAKHVENKEYYQAVPYYDRLDYCASMTEEWPFVMAVEQLLDWPVPARADFIRVILCELNRMASHCLTFGTFGMDVGAMTPIFYTFKQREDILDMFEWVTGARLLYNYFVVGGVNQDLPSGFADRCRSFLDQFEKQFLPELLDFLIKNEIYYERSCLIGAMTPELCAQYGITGPNLRGAGVKWDLRKNYPYNPEIKKGYSVYDQFEFDVPIGDAAGGRGVLGSCWDRMMVRYHEMRESCRIVRQALDKLPQGPVQHLPMPRTVYPNGNAYVATEAARGELGTRIIADGTDRPYRAHVNSPGFNAIYALPDLCRNILVADLIAVVGSLDFVMGEVGR